MSQNDSREYKGKGNCNTAKAHERVLGWVIIQDQSITGTPECSEPHGWKMRVIIVYDDEREEVIIYVSTYDAQGQSIKQTKFK